MEPDSHRMIRDLTALVRTPSVNPYDGPLGPGLGEGAVADLLLALMAEIGLETGRAEAAPGRPNVWGRLRGAGGGPTLMLAGHMDTVGTEGCAGDPFAARIEGGRLHGRGAVDMKGALAAMLETARLAARARFAGDLLLMFVADEEHLMLGSAAAGRSGPHADFVVVGEPTGLAVAAAHKGQSVFPFAVEGRAAHSSRPEFGASAILGAARLALAVEAHDRALAAWPPHPLLGTARATATLIEGGESHSAVPARALLRVDRRTLPGEAPEALRAEMLALAAAAGLPVSLGPPSPVSAALETPEEHPLVRAALAAAADIGAPARPVAFPGGTDAPNFGAPAVICGPGDLAQAHAADEWIETEAMTGAARLWLGIARRTLGETT